MQREPVPLWIPSLRVLFLYVIKFSALPLQLKLLLVVSTCSTAGCSTQKCRKKCCLLLPETSRIFFFFVFFCSSWKRGRLISHPASGCILIKSFVQWLQSILHVQQGKSPSDRYYLAYFYSWEFAAFGAIWRHCQHLVISSAEWMCQDGCFQTQPQFQHSPPVCLGTVRSFLPQPPHPYHRYDKHPFPRVNISLCRAAEVPRRGEDLQISLPSHFGCILCACFLL